MDKESRLLTDAEINRRTGHFSIENNKWEKLICRAQDTKSVKAVIEEIEGIINWGEYEELPDGTKIRDGHIMSEPWQALKRGIEMRRNRI